MPTNGWRSIWFIEPDAEPTTRPIGTNNQRVEEADPSTKTLPWNGSQPGDGQKRGDKRRNCRDSRNNRFLRPLRCYHAVNQRRSDYGQGRTRTKEAEGSWGAEGERVSALDQGHNLSGNWKARSEEVK